MPHYMCSLQVFINDILLLTLSGKSSESLKQFSSHLAAEKTEKDLKVEESSKAAWGAGRARQNSAHSVSNLLGKIPSPSAMGPSSHCR